MPSEGFLLALLQPLAGLFLKRYFGDATGDIGASLIGYAGNRISNLEERRTVIHCFEGLALQAAKQISIVFEKENNPPISAEEIAKEISNSVRNIDLGNLFIKKSLNKEDIFKSLRYSVLKDKNYDRTQTDFADRVLRTTVGCLVQIGPQIPEFEEKYLSHTLSSLNGISINTEEIISISKQIKNSIDNVIGLFEEHEFKKAVSFEEKYRSAVISCEDYMELVGIDVDKEESKTHRLTEAYVSLSISSSPSSQSDIDDVAIQSAEDAFSDLRADTGRILLRGQAGSGKSTLFRWMAIHAAKKTPQYGPRIAERKNLDSPELAQNAINLDSDISTTEDQPSELEVHWTERIPFLIRLRHCKYGSLPNPNNFISETAKYIGAPPTNWVIEVLSEGLGLVLIDGVDEVPDKFRAKTRSDIVNLVHAYPNNIFVVSTRPKGVAEDWLASEGFREAVVEEMRDEDIISFVDNWHAAVEAVRPKRANSPSMATVARDMKAQLRINPTISAMAQYPLLCSALCALHYQRIQLPEDQSAICDALTQMLIYRREEETPDLDLSDFSKPYRDLKPEQRRAIMKEIAHYMVRNGESVISRDQALAQTKQTLEGLTDCFPETADEVLDGLLQRSGLLREAQPGAVDFLHNTLKEFLAAEKFVDEDDVGMLGRNATDEAWQQVVVFSASTRKSGIADRLVTRLIDLAVSCQNEDDRRTYHILALLCRRAALHLSKGLVTQVDEQAKLLFPPNTMSEAKDLAAAGELAIPFLKSNPTYYARTRAACVRTLRLIGTPAATEAMRTYLSDSSKTVGCELAASFDPIEVPWARSALISIPGGLDERIRSRITSLEKMTNKSHIRNLFLQHTKISSLDFISDYPNLNFLIMNWTSINDLTPIFRAENLESFHLMKTLIEDTAPLAHNEKIQNLNLAHTKIENIGGLDKLKKLKTLSITGTAVTNIEELYDLENIEAANISNTIISDIRPFINSKNIKRLFMRGLQKINIDTVQYLKKLTAIDISHSKVSDISALSTCENLESLHMYAVPATSIAPLRGLKNLNALHINGQRVENLGPLLEMPALKKVVVMGRAIDNNAKSIFSELTRRGVSVHGF